MKARSPSTRWRFPCRSLLGADIGAEALAAVEPRDIKGFVPVPGEPWSWQSLLRIAALVFVALLRGARCVLLWWRRRRLAAPVIAPAVPAHLWAREQLDRLAAHRLVEQNQLHEFFFALSDIVRGYTERRFGLMAPERTTEEFIREMRSHPVLNDAHQHLLADFLRSADLVKFALHRPPSTECDAALRTAQAFVEQTAIRADAARERAADRPAEVAA